MFKLLVLTTLCLLLRHQATAQSVGPIANFIRTNFVGHPVIHNRASWVFDPEVAKLRRRQFIALHGDKGEWLIERIGLGIDGRELERLAAQRLRDEGHLGGLNYYLP